MVVFPDCKINLGLHIYNKRKDGYHNLATIFYPVPFHDALEIIPALGTAPADFTSSGLAVNGNIADNLCVKAYVLLKKDFPLLPTVKMHLHKAIPMGAGLGGGSSDAAFALQLLNKCFNLNLSQGQLINYAAQLGSDCAFFIINKPCLATGRGEILQPVTRSLSDYHLVLVHPGIHVDTKDAFEALQLQNTGPNTSSIQEMVQQPVENWPQFLFNDFEKPVFDKYPVLKAIKKQLYQAGAAYAAMSGSGSTVFGLFHKQDYPKVNIALPFVVTRVSL